MNAQEANKIARLCNSNKHLDVLKCVDEILLDIEKAANEGRFNVVYKLTDITEPLRKVVDVLTNEPYNFQHGLNRYSDKTQLMIGW